MPDREYPPYDGRVSQLCQTECLEGGCGGGNWGDPYGCGGCCNCRGGCAQGAAEQLAEVDDVRALARTTTVKPAEEYL